MARSRKELAISVRAADVEREDVIVVGGQQMKVADCFALCDGMKAIRFATGDCLLVHCETALTALRVGEGWRNPQ